MSRDSLLPFTSTRCTASTTLSSLSDPHDVSGFQKAACGKKEKKKYQVEYPCQLLPRVLQAHYQSPRSRLPEFKMVNISVNKASPFTGLQHPLSSELRIAPCLCGSCFSTSLYSTSLVKFRAPLLCGSCFSTCLYGTSITTLRYFYGLIKAAFEPFSVNRILKTDDNIPKNTRKMIVPIQVVFELEAVQKKC